MNELKASANRILAATAKSNHNNEPINHKNTNKTCKHSILTKIPNREFREALKHTQQKEWEAGDNNDMVFVCDSDKDGLGVFAKRAIKAGEIIAAYLGELRKVPDDEITTYMFRVDYYDGKTGKLTEPEEGENVPVIDATKKALSSVARYVNVAEYNWELNTCFRQHTDHMFLVATRDIIPGEELLTSYGPYTESHLPAPLHRINRV